MRYVCDSGRAPSGLRNVPLVRRKGLESILVTSIRRFRIKMPLAPSLVKAPTTFEYDTHHRAFNIGIAFRLIFLI